MSQKVVSLRGDPIATGEPNATVVSCLEKWLEAARSGDVVGVTIVLQHSDNTVSSNSYGVRSRAMVGVLVSAVNSITADIDDT